MALSFDHLDLTDDERRLIIRACGNASVVFLARLDKGLSGSSLWHAKWRLHSGVTSKDHVFKIGPKVKLERERLAIDNIVSAIEVGFPHVRYIPDDMTDQALLCQEFVGEVEGETISLRKYIESCRDGSEAGDTICRLYMERMKHWHSPTAVYPRETLALSEALDWWVRRMNLTLAAEQIGRAGLDSILGERFGINLDKLNSLIAELLASRVTVAIGAVHGDLHAQNILLGAGRTMQLIDFGWTNEEKWKAVDFLMMECSLKFVTAPPHALLADLMTLDELLDSRFNGESTADYTQLKGCVHGVELSAIAHAIHAVRYCALTLGATPDLSLYRLGLITLMAGLASLPTLINRVFLFQSIGYHLARAGRII